MRRHKLSIAIIVLSAILLVPGATTTRALENPNHVTADDPWGDCNGADAGATGGHYNCDGMQQQSELDKSNAESGQNNSQGNWYDLESPADLTSRPYVDYLWVTNGSTSKTIVGAGTTATTMSNLAGHLGVVIAPYNLCDKDRTPTPQAPADGVCYNTPNRVGVTLVYRKPGGGVGYNFSRPNDGSIPGNAVALKDEAGDALVIDENTEIGLVINLNTIGKSLRWTWMNGVPSFWKTSDLGTDAAQLEVHAKLAQLPIIDTNETYDNHLCSTVPVSTCNVTQANADWLTFAMVLSLDTSMSEAMTGALFATEGAVMGSVEVANDSTTGLPLLKYSAASSHLTAAGDTRLGKMHAYIPASALVQQLGVPSFTDSSALPSAATPSQVFMTQREGTCSTGCSAGTTTFTELNSLDNDFTGIKVDVEGLTFSTPKMRVKAKSGALKAPSARLSGSTYRISVASGTTSSSTSTANGICKRYGCTLKLYKTSTSALSSTLTLVSTKLSAKNSNVNVSFQVTRRTTGSAALRVQRGTRYIVVVTRKDTGAVVSSAPVVLP